MTEERDPEVSRRYRELGSEEPPRALDERILARARRRQGFRWYGPVAAAAILVLVVAVTVQVERQDPEQASAPAAPSATKTEPFAAPESPARDAARQEVPDAGTRERRRADAPAETQEQKKILGAAAALGEAPEAALERIAELRRQDRHEEADEALKRFRERFPDYAISDEVRAKVEKK